jgi:hypothetical protein
MYSCKKLLYNSCYLMTFPHMFFIIQALKFKHKTSHLKLSRGTECHPLQYTSFPSKRETVVPQWACKLNSAPATVETWHVEGRTLKVTIFPAGQVHIHRAKQESKDRIK